MGNTKGMTPQRVIRWSTAPWSRKNTAVAPAYRAHLKMVSFRASNAGASFPNRWGHPSYQVWMSKDLMTKTSTRLSKSAAGSSTA